MTLHVTVGLPRSGKSTWARSTGWPIVNPDSVRLALHGQRYYAPAEPLVWAVVYAMVEALRLAGHEHVVVDATNVSVKRRAEWINRYLTDVVWHVIEAHPSVCLARARAEGDAEIQPVIERMAAEWDFPCACGNMTCPGRASCCAECAAEQASLVAAPVTAK